jgi:hypothetical protein
MRLLLRQSLLLPSGGQSGQSRHLTSNPLSLTVANVPLQQVVSITSGLIWDQVLFTVSASLTHPRSVLLLLLPTAARVWPQDHTQCTTADTPSKQSYR